MAAKTLNSDDMATDQSSTVVLPDVMITAPVRPDIVNFVFHAQISNNSAVSRIPPVAGVENLQDKLGKLILTNEVYEKNLKEENIGSSSTISAVKVEGLDKESAKQRKDAYLATGRDREAVHRAQLAAQIAALRARAAATNRESDALLLRIAAMPKEDPVKELREILKLNPDAKTALRMSFLAEAQRVKAKKEKLAEKRKPVTKDDDLAVKAAAESGYQTMISDSDYTRV